jgi:DNA-binding MarR family transcriptional regulator
MPYDQSVIRSFGDAAQSLKLYRRAELRDDASDEPIIEHLYVDPLQNDSVLESMIQANTTFLIGRKGTGKSTIFQRAQHEIRRQKRSLSAYVDIKTVFESAEIDPAMYAKITANESSFSEAELKKLLLYRSFTRAVFIDIQSEIKKQLSNSIIAKLKEVITESRKVAIEALDELLEGAFDADHIDVTAAFATNEKLSGERSEKKKNSLSTGGKFAVNPKDGGSADLSFSVATERSAEVITKEARDYSRILLRTFNLSAIMQRLDDILKPIGIKKLYIFIDDFSELPEDAMRIFVDSVLAPLNNWSNELIKFKIAAYPGRIYLGKIDPAKIDEIYLDMFRLYGSGDVSSMEDKAIEFTQRLINSRFKYFLNRSFEDFCGGDSAEIYRQLFFSTMGNPRILGHVLHNLRESHVAYGNVIGVRAIRDAASKYYEEKVEPFFGVQKFVQESFGERSSIYSLKELLEAFVSRARELRNYKDSAITRDISGRTPSSHFHIVTELDSVVATLELNFFITKYFEMKDRDGRSVSVYALNFGLCNKYTVDFGRPSGRREHRLYFVERIFDYSGILRKYIASNQEIRCSDCNVVHSIDKLDSIRLFGMMCPSCRNGTCTVSNLSRKYESILKSVDAELLLPPTELGILETLYIENKELNASDIAGELDCSYQLIGKRGKIMAERGLVNRDISDKGKRVFSITPRAKDEYFASNSERHLNLPDEAD